MKLTQDEIAMQLSLAEEFSKILLHWNGLTNMRKAVALNAIQEDSNICHSHDFCDSNMAMEEAFINTYGREPEINSEDETDNKLWADAWDTAKAQSFFIKKSL